MKKTLVFSGIILVTGLLFFFLRSGWFDGNEKHQDSLTIELNENNSARRIEVRFTNALTKDSLEKIKDQLKTKGIDINYKKLVFDMRNHLLEISCEVDCNDGYSGSFGGLLSSPLGTKKMGFLRDYSANASIPFCTGNCNL